MNKKRPVGSCSLLAAQHGPSPEVVAAMFGVPVAGVREAYARNAKQLQDMAEQSTRTGRKVRGFTGEQLSRMATSAAQKAIQ